MGQPTNSSKHSLTVTDNRTGKTIEIPINQNAIPATAFKQLKAKRERGEREENETELGIRVVDPGYMNTATIYSKITYINGEEGILRYRGYDIRDLAEKSTFLEVSYLLLYGNLPTKSQSKLFEFEVMHHTYLPFDATELIRNFRYDAHPMSILTSGIAALSSFSPEANPALQGRDLYIRDKATLNKQVFRLLGKSATLAAMAYRIRIGRPFNAPRSDLSYAENFLYMLDHLSEEDYIPNPKLARALDILFILHADHEMNCSTSTMLHVGSSLVDPYSAVAAACSALYGPLHGGANEAVIRMLEKIGSPKNVPQFISDVKAKKALLMGFGHRVYRNYDPRSKIIRQVAEDVFEVCGRETLIDTAMALEKAATSDEYFKSRKLYPNVDFWSGLIYKAMGFPTDFYPVLFAVPRIAGWLAHWKQMIDGGNVKIWRPRQIYIGETEREYIPLRQRSDLEPKDANSKIENVSHTFSKRTFVATHKTSGHQKDALKGCKL